MICTRSRITCSSFRSMPPETPDIAGVLLDTLAQRYITLRRRAPPSAMKGVTDMRIVLALAAIIVAAPAFAQSPQLWSSDGRFLGNVNRNPYDPNSVSNPYGRYGNPYSPDSINNPYGKYGNPYSPYSGRNPFGN